MISNRFDPEKSAGFVSRFLKLETDFLSEKGSLMKKLKDDKEIVFEQADAEGIPRKILKLELERRKSDARYQEKVDRLDEDEIDQLDLFASAVARGLGEDEAEDEDSGEWKTLGEVAAEVVEKGGDAVIVNKGGRPAKDAAKRKSTTTEDRVAKRAKAVGLAPADEGQTDIEDAAKAATERDFAEADAETERFMDTSTNDRVAEPAT
ncbi:hypothetical protein [Acuticoccus sediminis]|uniref:hypothetical protein n=1 Tax=Acuticoccus sediminis TaxID=2184697 RepID=UPI001CFE07A6|nr:hypothetical protein [Acuticoccus sediminis]